MSYATGSIITKGHYNLLATGSEDGTYNTEVPNLGLIWGVGYGKYGYGQNLNYIAPVESGQVIRSQDWDNLDSIISNVIDHQLGTGNYSNNSPVQPGQLVTPIPRLSPGIQLAYNGVGKCFAPSESDYMTQHSQAWGGPGHRKLRVTQTLTFPTADHARWFFNAGGKLKLSFAYTPNPANQLSTLWQSIAQGAGAITIGYRDTTKLGGTTAPGFYQILPAGEGGFWGNSTNTLTEHFRQIAQTSNNYYGGYGYYGYGYGYNYSGAGNYLKVEMTAVDSDGINQNLGRQIKVVTTLVIVDTSNPPVGDTIQGNFKVTMTVSKPTTDYLPIDNWSSFTFNGIADVTG